MKLNFKSILFLVGIFVFTFGLLGVSNVNAAAGEGTATINTAPSIVLPISYSTTLTIELTVGASGMEVGTNQQFIIPNGFTAPSGTMSANVGSVTNDGDWFVEGSGGACASVFGGTAGQELFVTISGACSSGDKLTLTYKGTPSNAMDTTDFVIETVDTVLGGVDVAISTPPMVKVYGFVTSFDHSIGTIKTTNNLIGLAETGGSDVVLGGFRLYVQGDEVIDISQIRIILSLTGMDIGEITNLKIVPDNGAGGGTADDGIMQPGELAVAIVTAASPVVGNNDLPVSVSAAAASADNYFIVGTIADTVSDGDTLEAQVSGWGNIYHGQTSNYASFGQGASANDIRAITDNTPPTFTAARIALNTIALTFDEPVNASADTDAWTVAGASVVTSSAIVSGTTITLTTTGLTATDGTVEVNYVQVNGDVEDMAGTPNLLVDGGAILATDEVAPTVTISMSDTSLLRGQTSVVTFTFSEEPTDFDASDVTVQNGTLGAINNSNPLIQTATFTPTNNSQSTGNVISVGTAWTDSSFNLNSPVGISTSGTYTVDTYSHSSGGGSYLPGYNSSKITTPIVTATPSFTFTKLLKYTVTDIDVKELQKFLNIHSYQVATTGAGSPGHETNFFGALTKKAVIKFQLANKLVGDGIVGPKTNAVINSLK